MATASGEARSKTIKAALERRMPSPIASGYACPGGTSQFWRPWSASLSHPWCSTRGAIESEPSWSPRRSAKSFSETHQ